MMGLWITILPLSTRTRRNGLLPKLLKDESSCVVMIDSESCMQYAVCLYVICSCFLIDSSNVANSYCFFKFQPSYFFIFFPLQLSFCFHRYLSVYIICEHYSVCGSKIWQFCFCFYFILIDFIIDLWPLPYFFFQFFLSEWSCAWMGNGYETWVLCTGEIYFAHFLGKI